MADIERQFNVIKVANKTTTSINLPTGFGLKGFLEDIFDTYKASGKLKLTLPARKAIIDHLVTCPEIYGKGMQPKTTTKGFIVNGMIDDITHTYPDIIQMLQTCKSKITQQQEDLVFEHFSQLYHTMKTHGHISEELYETLGFSADNNYDGCEVPKPDEISQEMRHRAKILSHSLQCQLRDRRA